MTDGPFFIEKGCHFYKCEPEPVQIEAGFITYSCKEYVCQGGGGDTQVSCEFVERQPIDTDFVLKKDISSSQFILQDARDTTKTITKTLPLFNLDNVVGVKINELPDKIIPLNKFDIAYYLKNLSACNPEEDGIVAAPLEAPAKNQLFPAAIVSYDEMSIPMFTVSGTSQKLEKDAKEITDWIAKESANDGMFIKKSKMVAIFYPDFEGKEGKKIYKQAQDLATQYNQNGIYAALYKIEDVNVYKGDAAKPDPVLTRARKGALTIAYLPTGDADISELTGDLNNRTAQNNETAGEIIKKLFNGGNLSEEIYFRYLAAFGLACKEPI